MYIDAKRFLVPNVLTTYRRRTLSYAYCTRWICFLGTFPVGIKCLVNTLRPRQNGRNFADDIFKGIFFNENVWIPIKISLEFVPKGAINNIPSLVQIMVWRRPGAKPLSEPMMVSLLTHICVTRPQWDSHHRYHHTEHELSEDRAPSQYKDHLSRYRDSHVKDKAVVRPSYL